MCVAFFRESFRLLIVVPVDTSNNDSDMEQIDSIQCETEIDDGDICRQGAIDEKPLKLADLKSIRERIEYWQKIEAKRRYHIELQPVSEKDAILASRCDT
jgi:hypothetical protein